MPHVVRLLLVVPGAALLAGGSCDTAGPDRTDPDLLWTVQRWIATDQGVLTDSTVIVGMSDSISVASFDRTSGDIVWERPLSADGATFGGFFFDHTLMEYDGLVYAAPFHLHAVEAATGTIRWTFRGTRGELSRHPAIADGALYVSTQYGEVVRLDAITGAEAWRTDLHEAAFPATVADGIVVVGTRSFLGDSASRVGPLGDGHVVALRASDGAVLWKVPVIGPPGFPESGGVVASPVLINGIAVVGTRSNRVLGIRMSDGSLLWEHVADGTPVTSDYGPEPAGRFGNLAVLMRRTGAIDAFVPETGELAWSVGRVHDKGGEHAGPVIVDDHLYAVLNGAVWIVAADGTAAWRYGRTEPFDYDYLVYSHGPTVAPDGTIYVGGTDDFHGGVPYFQALRPPPLD